MPLPAVVRAGGVVAVLVAAFTTCRDALGPREGTLARVAVAPIFPSGAAMADFGLTIDRIRIIVVRPVADTIADTTAALPPDADFLDLDFRVPLLAARESLSVTIEALAGSIPLFSGTSLVEVRAGVSAPPPTEIAVTTYVGPGAGVDSIAVLPRAPFIYLDDSLRFQVQAFQAGAPVTQFYVSWSTSDVGVAPINGFGVLRAPSARTSVLVRARTPSGAADSAPVTFVPLPTQLIVVAGAGQSGTVGQVLETPLEVEVRAADGLPVGGVRVRFRSLSGGVPADTSVVSDAAGRARVPAVLGTTAGPQSFEANLPGFLGIGAATFGATAIAGQISAATSLVSVAAGTVISGSTVELTLRGKDANGNDVAIGGATVVFSTSGSTGASTGSISATTDDDDGTYTATFTGVVAGTATEVAASIEGQPVTTTPPAITVLPGPISVATSLLSVANATVVSETSTLLTLRAKDAAGNAVTSGGATVAFTASGGGGTSTGTIGPTTDHGNGTYTASFTGVAVGTAGTIGAVINDAAVTSSPLPTITVVAGAIDSIAVTPVTVVLDALNATQQLAGAAFDANGNPVSTTFTWTSSDTLVAKVDGTGLVTAAANGATTISAIADGVTGSASLTISQVVASVLVTPDAVVLNSLNATQQFAAQAFDRLGNALEPQPAFAWSSSDAVVASVSGAGEATALANGRVTIVAGADGVADSVTLDLSQIATQLAFLVEPSQVIAGDAISPAVQVAALDAGGSVAVNFTGSVTLVRSDSTDCMATLTGTTSVAADAGVASFGNLAIVEACADIQLSAQASALREVQSAPFSVLTGAVAAVTIAPITATLHSLGALAQFVAQAGDEFGNPIAEATFAWSSTNTAIGTVNQFGAATAVANGLAQIVATSGGVADTAELTVQQIVASVAVTPGDVSLPSLADTVRLTAEARDSGGSAVAGATFTWATSDGSIASVDGGLATALANGTVTITATTDGVSGSVSLTIDQVVTSVAVSPTTVLLDALGATQQLTAQAFDANGNAVAATFTWLSTDTIIAKVDGTGLATALANGAVTISAMAGDVTGSASLKVEQAAASIAVSPASATLNSLNATQQFTAEAVDRLGKALAPQPTFTWSSSAVTVAKVNQAGRATALANGLAPIVATAGGVADTAQLTVQQAVASVTVKPSSVLLTASGQTAQLTAEARDAGGSVVAGAVFTWSSSNTIVVLVDANGEVTAVAAGTATITAATGVQSGFAQVKVDLLGMATRLVFIQQPPSPVFFDEPFTVQVAAQDDSGNTVTSFTGDVVLSESGNSSNPVSTLGGTLTQPLANGVATFTGLFVDGTDTTAIDARTSPDSLTGTSATFHVVNQIVIPETGAAPYFAGVDTATDRIYVSNTAGSSATVLDGSTPKVAGTIDGLGENPGWEGVNPLTKQVFISDFVDGFVYVIDESEDRVVGAIAVGPNAAQPAVNWRGDTIYVPAQQQEALSLVIVDMAQREVVDTIPIAGASDTAAGALWDPASGLVWVVVATQGIVASVDPVNLKVVDTIRVGERPYGIALDPNRNRLYVTVSGQDEVAVIDLTEGVTLQPIGVDAFPQGLSVDVETGRVFVANRDAGTVSVIDGTTGELMQTVVVRSGPGDAEFNLRNRLVYVPNGNDNSISIVKPN